jgi:hypothetical protein
MCLESHLRRNGVTAGTPGSDGRDLRDFPASIIAAHPGEVARATVAAAARPAVAVDDEMLRHVHVLVVDDEEDARVLLEATLSQ